MATNKYALIRYKVLDKCFSNKGRRYFIENLIEECSKQLKEIDPDSNGISRRQIFDDMNFMKSNEGWNADIKGFRDRKRFYYRYENTDFSINNSPLSEYEINQLKSAMDIIGQFKGMPQFEFVNELLPKLHQGTFIDDNQKTIISFDSNEYLKGMHHFGALYNAILYRTVLKIAYKPYEALNAELITIHPYYLKQYNNRWFLFGLNSVNLKPFWNLAIDRIESIRRSKEKYQSNKYIDWNEYFDDMIGVTKPEGAEIEKIVLEVYGKTANYFITNPLHSSQKTKIENKNLTRIELNLIINYELERLILSYSDSIKVVEPKRLVKEIKKRIENSHSLYTKNL